MNVFPNRRRWWIFKAIWWFAVPPWGATSNAERFNTFEEAVDYFAANARPMGPGE